MKLHHLLLFLLVTATFTACEDRIKAVNKSNLATFTPSGEADSLALKYTDSGRITAVLAAKQMRDFATVKHPFTEFPKGIDLTLYDKKGKKTFITAQYAISYRGSDLIDLRKNVVIRSEESQRLETEQLFFDQKNGWFFTEKPFLFTDPEGGSTQGTGIDFNKDFKRINYQQVRGQINKAE
ncbi:LPS export ABC transporter periplasmic protein LptC [Flavobacterium sp.]|uniref:LPS export ABC transporter periplasmic protein LptC n=1 Tax=Flavobacterium sp. TaxID=239 RepID=UPI0026184B9C|nr:LPS export ABC transporter periplasmic protein LptC [Flavobacterium sp.]